jgi:hypothetical protein
MITFRTKMAGTLLSTVFNLRRGRPFLPPQGDKEDGKFDSPSEGIIEPGEYQKRNGKRKNTDDNDNALKLNKVDTMIDPADMDVLEYYKDQPLSRDRLMEIFCDYIMSIEDPAQLG